MKIILDKKFLKIFKKNLKIFSETPPLLLPIFTTLDSSINKIIENYSDDLCKQELLTLFNTYEYDDDFKKYEIDFKLKTIGIAGIRMAYQTKQIENEKKKNEKNPVEGVKKITGNLEIKGDSIKLSDKKNYFSIHKSFVFFKTFFIRYTNHFELEKKFDGIIEFSRFFNSISFTYLNEIKEYKNIKENKDKLNFFFQKNYCMFNQSVKSLIHFINFDYKNDLIISNFYDDLFVDKVVNDLYKNDLNKYIFDIKKIIDYVEKKIKEKSFLFNKKNIVPVINESNPYDNLIYHLDSYVTCIEKLFELDKNFVHDTYFNIFN